MSWQTGKKVKPVITLKVQEWTAHAVCATVDGNLWFPEKNDRMSAQRAKQICRTCPVINECLEAAITSEVVELGIWGGTSERERRNIRRAS